MGDAFPYILVALVALLVIFLAVVFWYWKKGKKHIPDYRAFFYMGIVWLAIGLPLENYGFFAMGIVFTVVGLVNKDKWGKHKRWGQLSKEERNFKLALILGLLALVLITAVAFFLIS